MFKKIGLTAVLSTAILFGGVITSSAASINDQPSNSSYKTQVYYIVNGKWQPYSGNNFSKFLEKCFPGLQINWDLDDNDKNEQPEKEESQEEAEAPKEEPVEQPEEQPAESEEQPVENPESPAPEEEVTEQPDENQNNQANYELSQYEQQVVELTNEERAKYGLSALQVDWELSRVAREKSNDMASNNYFSHTSPVYGSPFDMMKDYGIHYQSAGENIARGQRTPQEVVDGWMNSEGHRANILNENFTHIGVGFVEQGNYWTQQFIGK